MHYFEICKAVEGAEIDFRKLFEAMIEAPIDLSPKDFRRIGKVYDKFSELKDGEVLEVEDHDFGLLNQKLISYVKFFSNQGSNLIKNKIFRDFILAIEEMPTEKKSLLSVV